MSSEAANEIETRSNERLQLGGAGITRDAARAPGEILQPMGATSLAKLLEETARAHGYVSYDEMEHALAQEDVHLERDERDELLRGLVRADQAAGAMLNTARALPSVDATGLIPIADIAQSVARLIRVILVGYTEDEVKELIERVQAERASGIDGAAGQAQADLDHLALMDRLAQSSRLQARGPS